MFCKKSVLSASQNSSGNTCVGVLSFSEVAWYGGSPPEVFLGKGVRKMCRKLWFHFVMGFLPYFLILYQIFFSPQVKGSVIISNKHGIYELPDELPNASRLLPWLKLQSLAHDMRALPQIHLIFSENLSLKTLLRDQPRRPPPRTEIPRQSY